MEHSKKIGLLWILAAVVFAGLFVIGIPILAKKIPFEKEKSWTESIELVDKHLICKNEKKNALLKKIVDRVYPQLPDDNAISIEVSVYRSDKINAFAFLGGRIYICEELLSKVESAEALAGVLAHEIGHVKRRHIMQSLIVRLMTYAGLVYLLGDSSAGQRIINSFLEMQYTKQKEIEADKDAVVRLKQAEISLSGLKSFFEYMGKQTNVPDFLSDHPGFTERLSLLEKESIHDSKPILSPEEWSELKTICKSEKGL